MIGSSALRAGNIYGIQLEKIPKFENGKNVNVFSVADESLLSKIMNFLNLKFSIIELQTSLMKKVYQFYKLIYITSEHLQVKKFDILYLNINNDFSKLLNFEFCNIIFFISFLT